MSKHGTTPKMEEKSAMVRAPKGAKPGVSVANSTEIDCVVTAIDHKARTVIVKGPKGNEVTKTDKADVKGFDNVVISYKEILSISVVTPVPAAKSKP